MPLILMHPESIPYRSQFSGEFVIECGGEIVFHDAPYEVRAMCKSNKVNGEYDNKGYTVYDLTVYESIDYSSPTYLVYKEVFDEELKSEILEKLNDGEWFDEVIEYAVHTPARSFDVKNGEVKVVAEGLVEEDLYVLFNLYYVKKDGKYDGSGWWISHLSLYKPVEDGYEYIEDEALYEKIEGYILDGDYKEELIEPYLNE
jgi:hypothetical protein